MPITNASKYYPIEKRKFCSRSCVKKAWLTKNRPSRIEQSRRSHLKHKFGITLEEFDELYKAQKGQCAICGEVNRSYTDKYGRVRPSLYIDHHHTLGGIRGLLCQGCNTGLGYFKDTPERLIRAASYLQEGIKIENKPDIPKDPRQNLLCKDTSHKLIKRNSGGYRCHTCYLVDQEKRRIKSRHQGN